MNYQELLETTATGRRGVTSSTTAAGERQTRPAAPAPAWRFTLSEPPPGPATKLAVRVDEDNPNHHLWNNRGTWWCHFTVHRPDYTAERVRVSLKTRNLETARVRRDELLASLH